MNIETLRLMLNMLYDNIDIHECKEISSVNNQGFLIIKASNKSLKQMIANNPYEYPSYKHFKYYLLVNKNTNKISAIYKNIEYDKTKKHYICIGIIDEKDKLSIDILDNELNIIHHSCVNSDDTLNEICIYMKYRIVDINNKIFTFKGKLLNNFRFDDKYKLLVDDTEINDRIIKSKHYLEVVNQ